MRSQTGSKQIGRWSAAAETGRRREARMSFPTGHSFGCPGVGSS